MDLLHFPLVTYFIRWDDVKGTIVFGILGTIIFTVICTVCVYQMRNLRDD